MGDIYQILVIGFRGEKKTVDVATNEDDFNKTTVSVFKEKLMTKFPELKGAQFTMMFTSVRLEDTDTFSMRKIQNKSTIFLIVRMPGGGGGGGGAAQHRMKRESGTDAIKRRTENVCRDF